MRVDLHDFLNRRGFDKGGWDSFFNSKDCSFGCGDPDCGGSELLSATVVIFELTLMASIAYSTICQLGQLFMDWLADLGRDGPRH